MGLVATLSARIVIPGPARPHGLPGLKEVMKVRQCWVTFLESYPVPRFALPDAATPAFRFLASHSSDDSSATLTVLPGLGKVTRIGRAERQGTLKKKGVERIWKCLHPYLPVQCVPQLNLTAERTGVAFRHAALRVDIHTLGLVSMLSGRLEFEQEVDGYTLAKVLDSLENQKWLRNRCGRLKSARNVVQLFSALRDQIIAEVLAPHDAPVAPDAPMRPFCVLALDTTQPWPGAKELAADEAGKWELLCALQRYTSQKYVPAAGSTPPALGNRMFVNPGKKSETGVLSGWMFGTRDGVAATISPGDTADQAARALLCHSRNIAKLIGFYRLYQGYVASVPATGKDPAPRAIVEYAVNALDLMRVAYSRWWLSWAAGHLHLDKVSSVAASQYNLDRPFPPHANVQAQLSGNEAKTIRVFISYTHDGPDHEAKVRQVADRLREDGIDAMIDQYEPAPTIPWPQWMFQQLALADFVLMVFTRTYKQRFLGLEKPGVGLGGTWEGAYISSELYRDSLRNKRFIPVIFGAADKAQIPSPLDYTYYDLGADSAYTSLLRHVTRQPEIVKPELGVRPSLPPLTPRPDSGPGTPLNQ